MSTDVLHVLQDSTGGGPTQAFALARDAADRGAAVAVAVPSLEKLPRELVPGEGVEVVTLPDGPHRSTVLRRLVRCANVTHVHGARAAAWTLPVSIHAPLVVTFHGLHPLRRPASRLYRTAARSFIRMVARRASAVVAVARSEVVELSALGVEPRKINYVPNAVEPPPQPTGEERETVRRELGVAPGQLCLLMLGRLEAAKDPLTALRLAERLRDVNAALVIAGDGGLRPFVESVAGPNVRVLGHRADRHSLLAAADIVLNTSLWEGLSLTVLEAMWSGRTLIVSDAPGNIDAVGETALVVPRGDVDAYVGAVERLRRAEDRENLAAAARRRVERLFSFDRMLQETRQVYARAVTGAHR